MTGSYHCSPRPDLDALAPRDNPSFTGQMSLPAGSAAAPAMTFTGDPDTGLSRPAADTLTVATGGQERARVDSSGRFILGRNASTTLNGNQARVQVAGTGLEASAVASMRFSADASGPAVMMAKSRAVSVGSNVAVVSGDQVAQVQGYGNNGSGFAPAAAIVMEVDGTPGPTAMPGRILFRTTPNGSVTPAEVLRIGQDGAVSHRGNTTVIVDAGSHLTLRAYTVATLPSAAATGAGRLAFVSNGASNQRLAVCDGSAWRWPDGQPVS